MTTTSNILRVTLDILRIFPDILIISPDILRISPDTLKFPSNILRISRIHSGYHRIFLGYSRIFLSYPRIFLGYPCNMHNISTNTLMSRMSIHTRDVLVYWRYVLRLCERRKINFFMYSYKLRDIPENPTKNMLLVFAEV